MVLVGPGRVERELDRAFEAAVPRVLKEYLSVVLAVLVLPPLAGLWIARRTAKRVVALSRAARRVGEGDLSVQLAPRGRDELDELGRAFDAMVSELSEARSRLAYMQKVSAWQEVARRLAHEIKNPLTPIQLAVQELASKYEGDDPKYLKLVATPKHFAVHSGPEGLRHSFNAIASQKDLYETYLPAFFECVTEAKAHSVMPAYNRTNGEPCCASDTLLRKILREDWGFQGYIVSDCWAIRDIHENHKVTRTPEESAAMAVKAGTMIRG